MSMTLQEQAWQSGLVLLDEDSEWNTNDWPPLEGGWREYPASVVIDHPDKNNDTSKRQTVVVMGGFQLGQGNMKSVLVLNLSESNQQWREGPPMNKKKIGHAAVVCNGSLYVIGGRDAGPSLDCIEQIDANDLLQSSSISSNTNEIHWKTLNCRLSTGKYGCGAVAVHNRYLVVVGGRNQGQSLSSVDIIDTNNHSVTVGACLNAPRFGCASVVVGHRIFVVGGHNNNGYPYLESVEYLDFAKPCAKDETKKETASTIIMSLSSTWTTLSGLVLSRPRHSCAAVAVGSCIVVAGGEANPTVQVLDTHSNRMWNLPSIEAPVEGCSMVTVANQIAVIGGYVNPSCATLPFMDKHSWCFSRLCEQLPNDHSLEEMHIQHAVLSPLSTSTFNRKRVKTNP